MWHVCEASDDQTNVSSNAVWLVSVGRRSSVKSEPVNILPEVQLHDLHQQFCTFLMSDMLPLRLDRWTQVPLHEHYRTGSKHVRLNCLSLNVIKHYYWHCSARVGIIFLTGEN